MSEKIALQTMIANCLKMTHQIKQHEKTIDQWKDEKRELTKRIKGYLDLEEKGEVIVTIDGAPLLVVLTGSTYNQELHFYPLSDLETVDGTKEYNLPIQEEEDKSRGFSETFDESFFKDFSTIDDLKIKEE